MRTRWRFPLRAVLVVFVAALALARGSTIDWSIYPAAWEPQTSPHARGTTNRSFERTPARLQRGEYLADNVLGCFRCHSERDWNSPGAPPVTGKKGAGYVFVKGAGPVDPRKPPSQVFAPNITPDPETGAGRWRDDMLSSAIRESVDHDGRPFSSPKFHKGFRNLSDEDLASVIVYLRSIPAVHNPVPKTMVNASQSAELGKRIPPLTTTMPEPELSDPVRRGEYLVGIAACAACHTSDVAEASVHEKEFGGGTLMSDNPDHYVMSPNITMDPSGIGYYDQAMFIRVMRTGQVGTRKLYPIMPWGHFRKMTDKDLKAIFAFLKTQPRAQHIVDNTEPPTQCRRCLQRHGAGDRN